MYKLKTFLRKIIPDFILSGYHLTLALLADFYYGHPSGKLVVIGITGTKGKTSTANFVWSMLNHVGIKTGQLGTAMIRLGDREMLSDLHMTMPSPFTLQKFLNQMLDAGCTHVVMEATSEGMKLWRHVGIEFDVAVFTNLTPEHLPSHGGSFENYKNEKTKLFKALGNRPKILNGIPLEKIIIANKDSEFADFYLQFPANKKYTYSIKQESDFQATQIQSSVEGVNFKVENQQYHLNTLGEFNIYNALPAIALAKIMGIKDIQIALGIGNLKSIPGRMEIIDEGQKFKVLVDYAHEKTSFETILDTAIKLAPQNKIIVLMGAQGGGRDKSKRLSMGELAAKKADYIICSNEDPYDDDPKKIIEDIASAVGSFGKIRDQNLFVIEDRRAGIAKALSLAQAGDIVLITGKGAEQTMMVAGGKSIPWDDRKIVREELKKTLK